MSGPRDVRSRFSSIDRFNEGIGLTLMAGHTCVAYVKVVCDAAIYGVGECSADFERSIIDQLVRD